MSTNLPTSMRAVIQTVYGAPDVLHFATVPVPELRPRDLLIHVKAASVNPVDTKRRRGGPLGEAVPEGYKIVGWDAAGVLEPYVPRHPRCAWRSRFRPRA